MPSEPIPTAPDAERVRLEMLAEGRRLVDAARSRGIDLRLLGGLAVREHCLSLDLCARDYSDLDMVASAKQAGRLSELFASFGYTENFHVSTATGNAELQFVRSCQHGGPGTGVAHADDHIDVFLDSIRMDHDIALTRRLRIEPYTVSLSDLLLTKLQIHRLNDKDVRDIVTLLSDAELGDEDAPGMIDTRYIARLCADDWGLFYDVTLNLQQLAERAAALELSDAQMARTGQGVARLIAAVDGAPKSVRWRLRARVGTRTTWHNELDEQE